MHFNIVQAKTDLTCKFVSVDKVVKIFKNCSLNLSKERYSKYLFEMEDLNFQT